MTNGYWKDWEKRRVIELAAAGFKAYQIATILGTRSIQEVINHADSNKIRITPGGPVAARRCLECRQTFKPKSRCLFMCDKCKKTPAWREGYLAGVE